mmetsp:Transcript_18266/g.62034  ORF Transcript_18266/g.62034 Transcript_18266/m.62034 type:complete len:594 (-) Transcript_18266:108-1889(-)
MAEHSDSELGELGDTTSSGDMTRAVTTSSEPSRKRRGRPAAKFEPQPDVMNQQLCLPWTASEADELQTGLRRINLEITTAPGAFNRPLKPGQKFNPPFTVRVTVESLGPLAATDVEIRAYALNQTEAADLEVWDPRFHTRTDETENDVVQCRLPGVSLSELSLDTQVAGALGEIGEGFDALQGTLLTVSHEGAEAPEVSHTSGIVEFDGFMFVKSTFMQPRYLAFVWTHPAGKELGYAVCMYKLPTVVVSRSSEQSSRALMLLQGHKYPRRKVDLKRKASESTELDSLDLSVEPDRPVGIVEFLHRVHGMYKEESSLTRPLTEDDLEGLAVRAGLDVCDDQKKISLEAWASFKHWMRACLGLLEMVEDLWNKQNPPVMCSFAVGASDMTEEDSVLEAVCGAERELDNQPVGTFYVWFGTEPGTLVISTVVDPPEQQSEEPQPLVRSADPSGLMVSMQPGPDGQLPSPRLMWSSRSGGGAASGFASASAATTEINNVATTIPSPRGQHAAEREGSHKTAFTHQVIDAEDLSSQRLDGWVKAISEAKWLLDTAGDRHNKFDVFHTRYRRLRSVTVHDIDFEHRSPLSEQVRGALV